MQSYASRMSWMQSRQDAQLTGSSSWTTLARSITKAAHSDIPLRSLPSDRTVLRKNSPIRYHPQPPTSMTKPQAQSWPWGTPYGSQWGYSQDKFGPQALNTTSLGPLMMVVPVPCPCCERHGKASPLHSNRGRCQMQLVTKQTKLEASFFQSL